jgi:hypothetical protein
MIIIVLELQKVPKLTTKIHNIRTKTSTTLHPSKGEGFEGGACCQNKPTKKGKKEGKKSLMVVEDRNL